MKLTEYMETHGGEYLLAETTQPITVDDLDPSLRVLEVEPYLLGENASGQRKIHVYSVDRPFHIVTLIETVEDAREEPSRRSTVPPARRGSRRS